MFFAPTNWWIFNPRIVITNNVLMFQLCQNSYFSHYLLLRSMTEIIEYIKNNALNKNNYIPLLFWQGNAFDCVTAFV